MAVVAVDKLSKRYENAEELAVNEVSFTVDDNEFMVLLGPSGCGKSSILRMLAGLEPITEGAVTIDGRVMNRVAAKDRDIAMVFQSYALYPHMDVYNNLAFGLRRRKVARSEIDVRVRAVAAKLGLEPFLKRKPSALSGGQRQRVALGRAIVREPKVFLFDEPLSNLDAALRVSTRNELIRQQRELGTTTIYVTHDQVEAMTMGHRICIMNLGKVMQIGRPLEVYRYPANTFVARFLGSPPMNLLTGRIEYSSGHPLVCLGDVRFRLPADLEARTDKLVSGKVTVGLRPEDIHEATVPGYSKCAQLLPVRVVTVEPLGAETILVLALRDSGVELIARVGPDSAPAVGVEIDIAFEPGAVHLFDAADGRSLTRSKPC